MKRNLYLDQLGKKSLEASKSIFNLDEKIKNKVLYDYIKIINSNKNKIINPKIKKLDYSKECVFHQYVIKTKNVKNFENFLSKKIFLTVDIIPIQFTSLLLLKSFLTNKFLKIPRN